MDKVKLNKIKEILGHFIFQYSIINKEVNKLNKKNKIEPNLLKFLISQNKREKEIIELLGGEFPDSGIIDNLNKAIRELENKNVEKGELSFENISKFIEIKNKEITERLNNKYGLNAFVRVLIGNVIEINFSNLKICPLPEYKDYRLKFANTDKEQELLKSKMEKQHECAKKYFLFNDDNYILFNDKNYNTLIEIINKEFGELGKISNIETTNRYSLKKSDKKDDLIIVDASFQVMVLKSQLTFEEQINKL